MADYYTMFSANLPLTNEKEKVWCEVRLRKLSGEEDENGCSMFPDKYEVQDGNVWICSEESGDVEKVADFVQSFLQAFNKKFAWSLEWSNSCSKMRTDGFGGGAVVVTAEGMEWMPTSMWADKTVDKLEKKLNSSLTDEQKWKLIKEHQKRVGESNVYPTKALRLWAELQGKKGRRK